MSSQREECKLVRFGDVEESRTMGVEAPHFVMKTDDGDVGEGREDL